MAMVVKEAAENLPMEEVTEGGTVVVAADASTSSLHVHEELNPIGHRHGALGGLAHVPH